MRVPIFANEVLTNRNDITKTFILNVGKQTFDYRNTTLDILICMFPFWYFVSASKETNATIKFRAV